MAQNAFKPIWILFAGLCAVVLFVGVGKFFQPKEIIPWRTNFPAAQAEAREANKPVLLYFTASWCGPCQNMKHTTWADPKVDAALRDYVPVRIDVDESPIIAKTFDVQAMPSYVVLSPNGDQLVADAGAMDSEAFLAWLGSFKRSVPASEPGVRSVPRN